MISAWLLLQGLLRRTPRSTQGASIPLKTGSKAGIQPKHDKKLRLQLTALDAATQPQDLAAIPSWRLHELKGSQAGRWSINVNGKWRLTFTFEGTDVVLLDYEDYH